MILCHVHDLDLEKKWTYRASSFKYIFFSQYHKMKSKRMHIRGVVNAYCIIIVQPQRLSNVFFN